MSPTLRLPNRQPFGEIASDHPKAFSLREGLSLRLVKRREPGYDLSVKGSTCRVEYATTSDLMRSLGQWLAHPGESRSQVPPLGFRGLMIDSSRNAVIKPEVLKGILRRLALFGYNAVCLYTEDTYEVDRHPEMGYLRGKYSQRELRALDAYAAKLGIEMFPCIQTLGHMEQILSHPNYRKFRDDDHILNIKMAETYHFIEALIESAAKPYESRRIHLGLDETWGLSRGRAFVPNTPIDPRNDYLDHLQRLMEICRAKGLKPMMWGDIVIGMSGTQAFSEDQVAKLPKDMKMVFWNYYQPDPEYYRSTIRQYRKMGFDPMVAPGLWSWGRLWASQSVTDVSAKPFMTVAREEGISEALMTMWGDDGHETPFAANYPAIAQFADDCWCANPRIEDTRALVKAVCGTEFEAYTLPGRLDHYPGRERESVQARANISKSMLWDDPLLGIFAKHYAGIRLGPHIHGLSDLITKAAKGVSKSDSLLFSYARALAGVLEVKVDLHNSAREAYVNKDLNGLKEMSNQIPEVIRRMRRLLKAHSALWLDERKPFGLEVLQIRYGGQLVRLAETKDRIDAYLEGKTTNIMELEEKPIKLWPDPIRVSGNYGRIATISTIR